MKKPFPSHKIGRFLGKNRVKNFFFYVKKDTQILMGCGPLASQDETYLDEN